MVAENDEPEKPHVPPRVLGLLSVVAITYFCVSGGAYGLEIEVASAPAYLVLFLNLIIPWLWGLPLALITAELSCSMPEDGGCVVWGTRAFGHFYGWIIGWMSFWASTFDTSLYPVLFASYLSQTLKITFPHLENWGIAVLVVICIACINIYGADLVGVASYIFGAIVLAPFIIMCSMGSGDVHIDHLATIPTPAFPDTIQWAPLLSTVLWCSSGWDDVGQLAGEIKEPAKNFPRALIITMLLVIVSYVVPLGVGISVDPISSHWVNGYFSVIASKLGGEYLRIFLGIGGMMSCLGLFNCLLCASARLVYCLSSKGYIPKFLSFLTPKRDTPVCAILFNSVLVGLLGFFSFKVLIEMDFLLYSLTIMLEYAAWFKLRVREPEMKRPYSLPFSEGGYAKRVITGIILILCPLALTAFNFYHASHLSQILCVGAIVLGCALYGFAISISKVVKKWKRMFFSFESELSVQEERTVLLSA